MKLNEININKNFTNVSGVLYLKKSEIQTYVQFFDRLVRNVYKNTVTVQNNQIEKY